MKRLSLKLLATALSAILIADSSNASQLLARPDVWRASFAGRSSHLSAADPSLFAHEALISSLVEFIGTFHSKPKAATDQINGRLLLSRSSLVHTSPTDVKININPEKILAGNDTKFTIASENWAPLGRQLMVAAKSVQTGLAYANGRLSVISPSPTPEGRFVRELFSTIDKLGHDKWARSHNKWIVENVDDSVREAIQRELVDVINRRLTEFPSPRWHSGHYIGLVVSRDRDFLAAQIPFTEFSWRPWYLAGMNGAWADQLRQIWELATPEDQAALAIYVAEKLKHALLHEFRSPESVSAKRVDEARVLLSEASSHQRLRNPAQGGSPAYQAIIDGFLERHPELIGENTRTIRSGRHYGPGGLLDQIWEKRDSDPDFLTNKVATFGGGPLVHTSPIVAEVSDRENDNGRFLSIPRKLVPKDLVSYFKAYNIILEDVKVHPLNGDEVSNTILLDKQVGLAVRTSIGQALASIDYSGGGSTAKEVADGNAVFLTDKSLRDHVRTHRKEAIVILGDEGKRDLSYSLPIASVYFHEYEEPEYPGDTRKGRKRFEKPNESPDVGRLAHELMMLRARGITIRYFVGDALENTNGLINKKASEELQIPTNSWSVTAFFDQPQYLVHDKAKLGGVEYNAPAEAGVGPFDLPSVALPKIAAAHARAWGFKIGSADYEEAIHRYINTSLIVALGPRPPEERKAGETDRHRNWQIIDDARHMMDEEIEPGVRKYPGLRSFFFSDGDCMPRIIAGLGINLDGYHMVAFGRSGSAEATAAALTSALVEGAYFPRVFVAEKATNNDFNEDTAKQYRDEEVEQQFVGVGIPREMTTRLQEKDFISGKGLLALTAVTGASSDLFGPTFAGLLHRIRFEPNPHGTGGRITANTLLVTRQGTPVVVRTHFVTPDLQETRAAIKYASPAGQAYLQLHGPGKSSKGGQVHSPIPDRFRQMLPRLAVVLDFFSEISHAAMAFVVEILIGLWNRFDGGILDMFGVNLFIPDGIIDDLRIKLSRSESYTEVPYVERHPLRWSSMLVVLADPAFWLAAGIASILLGFDFHGWGESLHMNMATRIAAAAVAGVLPWLMVVFHVHGARTPAHILSHAVRSGLPEVLSPIMDLYRFRHFLTTRWPRLFRFLGKNLPAPVGDRLYSASSSGSALTLADLEEQMGYPGGDRSGLESLTGLEAALHFLGYKDDQQQESAPAVTPIRATVIANEPARKAMGLSQIPDQVLVKEPTVKGLFEALGVDPGLIPGLERQVTVYLGPSQVAANWGERQTDLSNVRIIGTWQPGAGGADRVDHTIFVNESAAAMPGAEAVIDSLEADGFIVHRVIPEDVHEHNVPGALYITNEIDAGVNAAWANRMTPCLIGEFENVGPLAREGAIFLNNWNGIETAVNHHFPNHEKPGVSVTGIDPGQLDASLGKLESENFVGQAQAAFEGRRGVAGKMGRLGFDPNNRMGWWWGIQNILGRGLLDPRNRNSPIHIASAIMAEHPRYIILCGMGGSSLAVGTLLSVFGQSPERPKIFTLDTTDPTALRNIQLDIFRLETKREWTGSKADQEELVHILKTLTQAVGVTKSARTTETRSHLAYFAKFGVPLWMLTDPAADMDPDSRAARIERSGGMIDPERIFWIELDGNTRHGGRFSAPATNVPLLPSVLMGRDVAKDLESALRYSNLDNIKEDRFIRLGAILDQLERQGKDKVTFIFPRELRSVALWLEQLVEESLGKDGKGITIFFEEDLSPEYYSESKESDPVFVRFYTPKDKPEDQNFEKLKKAGQATIDIPIGGKNDLMALEYGCERMVATFAYLQDIVFVNQPSVEFYKQDTAVIMRKAEETGDGHVHLPDISQLKVKAKSHNWVVNVDELLDRKVITLSELEAKVQEIGGRMDNGVDVYAAVMLLAADKGVLGYGEFALFGYMPPALRSIFGRARLHLFNRFQKRAKVDRREQGNHSHEENAVGGKRGRFSTFFVTENHPAPLVGEYSDDVIKASALGTVQSRTRRGRFAVLLMADELNPLTEQSVDYFFSAVARKLQGHEDLLRKKPSGQSGVTMDVRTSPTDVPLRSEDLLRNVARDMYPQTLYPELQYSLVKTPAGRLVLTGLQSEDKNARGMIAMINNMLNYPFEARLFSADEKDVIESELIAHVYDAVGEGIPCKFAFSSDPDFLRSKTAFAVAYRKGERYIVMNSKWLRDHYEIWWRASPEERQAITFKFYEKLDHTLLHSQLPPSSDKEWKEDESVVLNFQSKRLGIIRARVKKYQTLINELHEHYPKLRDEWPAQIYHPSAEKGFLAALWLLQSAPARVNQALKSYVDKLLRSDARTSPIERDVMLQAPRGWSSQTAYVDYRLLYRLEGGRVQLLPRSQEVLNTIRTTGFKRIVVLFPQADYIASYVRESHPEIPMVEFDTYDDRSAVSHTDEMFAFMRNRAMKLQGDSWAAFLSADWRALDGMLDNHLFIVRIPIKYETPKFDEEIAAATEKVLGIWARAHFGSSESVMPTVLSGGGSLRVDDLIDAIDKGNHMRASAAAHNLNADKLLAAKVEEITDPTKIHDGDLLALVDKDGRIAHYGKFVMHDSFDRKHIDFVGRLYVGNIPRSGGLSGYRIFRLRAVSVDHPVAARRAGDKRRDPKGIQAEINRWKEQKLIGRFRGSPPYNPRFWKLPLLALLNSSKKSSESFVAFHKVADFLDAGRVKDWEIQIAAVDLGQARELFPPAIGVGPVRVISERIVKDEGRTKIIRVYVPLALLLDVPYEGGSVEAALVEEIAHEILQQTPSEILPDGIKRADMKKGDSEGPAAHWWVTATEIQAFHLIEAFGEKLLPRHAADLRRAISQADEYYLQHLAETDYEATIRSDLRKRRKTENPEAYQAAVDYSKALGRAAKNALDELENSGSKHLDIAIHLRQAIAALEGRTLSRPVSTGFFFARARAWVSLALTLLLKTRNLLNRQRLFAAAA